jgi:hypothetical protein
LKFQEEGGTGSRSVEDTRLRQDTGAAAARSRSEDLFGVPPRERAQARAWPFAYSRSDHSRGHGPDAIHQQNPLELEVQWKPMRLWILATALSLLLPVASGAAQFKGYFDVSHVSIQDLTEPNWWRRQDGDRIVYYCLDRNHCPPPTAITIKGVLRAESLPAAFAHGALSPDTLLADGRANAQRTGSRFLSAKPVTIAGVQGVHMEASADMDGTVYFVSRWLGHGHRLLDVKVTARNLDLARQLADLTTRRVVPQVFSAATQR